MGCFNATCGVSRLPIFAGEPIRLCLIVGHAYKLADDNLIRTPGTWRPDIKQFFVDDEGNKHESIDKDGKWKIDMESYAAKERNDKWRSAWYSGLTYAEDVFFPRCVALKGKYDDYGGIDHIENSINLTAIHDQFALDLDEYPAGKYDIPVEIRRGMPLEGDDGLLRAIRRGGVTVNRFKDERPHARGHHLPVATWMVREDIYQAMLNAEIKGRWHDDEDSSLQRLYDAAEDYRQELIADVKKLDGILEDKERVEQIMRSSRALRSGNPLVSSMRSPPFENGINFYDGWIFDGIRTKRIDPDGEPLRALLKDIAEFSYFCLAKEVMRVAWMPQCGDGFQDERMSVHLAVAQQVIATVTKKHTEWADEGAGDD